MRKMNNKQSSSGNSSGGMGRNSSPSPPPSTLCFRQSSSSTSSKISNNSNTTNAGNSSTDKKHHRYHYHDPYHSVGLCGCHRISKSRCVSAFGVLILVLAYTAMGSILFMTLEGEIDDTGKTVETAVAASKPRTDLVNADIRSRTVDRLWSITEDLNILYKENWTRLAAQEVQQFQDMLLRAVRATKIQQTGAQPSIKPHKWSYASAFLYSITLITTIGFGGISPRTQWGRIAALLYAVFGIPLVLLYLSAMGDGLATLMRCLFRRLRSCGSGGSRSDNSSSSSGSNSNSSSSTGIGAISGRPENGAIIDKNYHNAAVAAIANIKHSKLSKSNQNYGNNRFNNQFYNYHYHRHSAGVPISICIMILICYVTFGAVLFHRLQNWNVLESLYFCFSSLGTIGFGELVPVGTITQYAASAYILVGMAIVAMCFSLIQSEIAVWMRKFGSDEQIDQQEKIHASTISGVGSGSSLTTGLSSSVGYSHMMPPHAQHTHYQLGQNTPIEDVALVTVAVAPKS